MGELVTERGIGNGMSLLIFAGIAARIPAEGKTILDTRGGPVFAAVCGAALLIIIGVVFVEQGSAASRSSTPSAWWAVACTAARRPAPEGQPGRRHPGDLRVVADLHPAPGNPADSERAQRRAQQQLVGPFRRPASDQPADPTYVAVYFALIMFLHLLLRLGHVQP